MNLSARIAVALGAVSLAAVLAGTGVSAHSVGESPTPAVASALAACPVHGPSVFVDSWGDPRSGGRRHEGVDMEGFRGTPIIAVQDGEAEFKQTSLGGNSIWLVTTTGERYFYAHLDGFEGVSRSVRAGEVIGYLGSTGNAAGNHLHFEVRLGETATNPYPYVSAACGPESWVAEARAADHVAERPSRLHVR